MKSQISGDSGYEGYAKAVFSYISNDDNIRGTISSVERNYPSKIISEINAHLNSRSTFLNESNDISTTTGQLEDIEYLVSDFNAFIGNYIGRMQCDLISPLTTLTDNESTILKINNNGNGIKDKYDKIKHKVVYCKSSLEYEVERLESISKNARMLQKHLELLILILNKHKKIEDKLNQFKTKLETHKKNKDISMKYITSLAKSIVPNLGKIQTISNSLKFAIRCVRIATIKQDVENINSSIKDINNILYVIKSQLIMLDPFNFGIDCGTVNEVECCIKEIVCGIHSKYYSLSSDISTVFSEPSSVPTLEGCQLTKITECTCSIQDSSEACGICQHDQGGQSCQCCHALQQLLTASSQSNIKQKLDCINKVICRLIDGKTVDGCQQSQNGQHQCSHSCQTSQGGQATSTCPTTIPGEKTTNICLTTVGQLIKCTLNEIKQCQKTLLNCEDKEEVKCEDPPDKTCQITTGTYPTSSCSSGTPGGVESCKDLDKVKLCVDTMVNKCNCCQFKKMLNDGKVKCFDVFKWLIISNFRELFSFYICFDKSILNEISCITEKFEQSKFYLKVITFIHGEINCRIDCIKSEINESTKNLESLVKIMRSGINRTVLDLECAIDGVARNFIRCTLISPRKHGITGNINNNNMRFNTINIRCVI